MLLIVMNEQLIESLTALIAGMGTVFVVLILISLIIGSFRYLNVKEKEHKHKKQYKEPVIHQPAEVKDDMGKIVAAITVALSHELHVPSDHLKIRSIRRATKTG